MNHLSHVHLRILKYEINSNENGGKVLFEIKFILVEWGSLGMNKLAY